MTTQQRLVEHQVVPGEWDLDDRCDPAELFVHVGADAGGDEPVLGAEERHPAGDVWAGVRWRRSGRGMKILGSNFQVTPPSAGAQRSWRPRRSIT